MKTETETKETEYNLAAAKKLVTSLAAEAHALQRAGRDNVSQAVSDWLAAQYLMVLHARLEGKGDEPEIVRRWETLRTALPDWARLRRGDLQADKLELDVQNSRFQQKEMFKQWLNDPKVREEHFPQSQGGISEATLHKIERELNLL